MSKVNKTSRLLIVGDGRLARHWKHYLTLCHVPFLCWHRNEPSTFEDFIAEHVAQISSVYLLISDGALKSFYDKYHNYLPTSTSWYHASGALTVPGMIDAHPLMTFPPSLYDSLRTYQKVNIVTSASPSALAPLLQDLPNPIRALAAENKARYHALCVLGAAGTGSLWALLENEWSECGIPKEAWKPYQEQIFANLIKTDKDAITGPWVRGDSLTISKNQEALSSPAAKQLYELLKGIFDEHAKR